MRRVHGNVIAGCFALSAFLVAMVSGLAATNPVDVILVRAVLAMVICYPLGLLVGRLTQWVIDQHQQARRSGDGMMDTPPDEPAAAAPGDRAAEVPESPVGTRRRSHEDEDALAVSR